jgi:hypothetical protein
MILYDIMYMLLSFLSVVLESWSTTGWHDWRLPAPTLSLSVRNSTNAKNACKLLTTGDVLPNFAMACKGREIIGPFILWVYTATKIQMNTAPMP